MSKEQCQSTGYGQNTLGWKFEITDNMLCSEGPGKGACNGDSGGPLVTNEGSYNSVIGVVSWGKKDGCALPGYPTVMARVTSKLDWIQEHITGTQCPKPEPVTEIES